MGQPIEITRTDHFAAGLRGLTGKTDDGAVVRRLLAVARVLEGTSREEAAKRTAMTRQTLRDWVHRDNAEGVEGLRSRTSPGRLPALSAAQKVELRAIVLKGPDPARHMVVRWRCSDLCE